MYDYKKLLIYVEDAFTLSKVNQLIFNNISDVLVTKRILTLDDLVNDLFELAEELYGKRVWCLEPLVIDFKSIGAPLTDYLKYRVSLSKSAALDIAQLIYQLSHELIHVLVKFMGDKGASIFEEGLATHFQVIATSRYKFYSYITGLVESTSKYSLAYVIVSNIINSDSNFIKNARGDRPILKEWDAKFMNQYHKFSKRFEKEIEISCISFKYWNGEFI